MKRYLGIDVGTTTGFAFVGEGDDVMAWGTIAFDKLETSILRHYTDDPDTDVCIEYPVIMRGPAQEATRRAADTIRRMFPKAATVQPGTWKTSNISIKDLPNRQNGNPVTQHQKDAVGIARWRRAQVNRKEGSR